MMSSMPHTIFSGLQKHTLCRQPGQYDSPANLPMKKVINAGCDGNLGHQVSKE
jgi:hypothetical protein